MTDGQALIIYDGDCIFCSNYVQFVRLRDAIGKVDLVDARSGDPRVIEYQRLGYDLNQGMLFANNGVVYHGADAVHVLASLSTPCSGFNRMNRFIFQNKVLARVLYPVLKLGRQAVLVARGKSQIRHVTDFTER